MEDQETKVSDPDKGEMRAWEQGCKQVDAQEMHEVEGKAGKPWLPERAWAGRSGEGRNKEQHTGAAAEWLRAKRSPRSQAVATN